ncbi:FAD-dependent oxidoreductase, partial [Planctomycetota bacterium]
KVMYHTHACRPIVNRGIIRAVPVETKSGRQAIAAKVFVDATGDADLAALCGVPCFEHAKEKMTSWFRAAGSDVKSPPGMSRFFKASPIIESGDYHGDIKGKAASFNPLTSEGLTGWEMAAREMIFEKIAAMRKRLGNDVYPSGSPTHPNVRKTRRIIGTYRLGRKDNRRQFDDSIGTLGFWVVPGEVYEIPYRCLVPKRAKNLLVAGRAISTTEDGWDITRIISGCVLTGEACGTAAAIAAKKRISVADVDPACIRGPQG